MKYIRYIISILMLSLSAFAEIDIRFNTPTSKRKTGEGTPCQKMVVDTITQFIAANKTEGNTCSLKIAMYSLDNLPILTKLNEAHTQGVPIELLVDKDQNDDIDKRLSASSTAKYTGTLKTEKDNTRNEKKTLFDAISPGIVGKPYVKGKGSYLQTRSLHEKIAIFSCKKAGTQTPANTTQEENNDLDAVILGSYNWTSAASTLNYENCVLIQNDPVLIEKAKARFDRIKAAESPIAPSILPNIPVAPANPKPSTSSVRLKTSSVTQQQTTNAKIKNAQQPKIGSPSPYKTRTDTEYGNKKIASAETEKK